MPFPNFVYFDSICFLKRFIILLKQKISLERQRKYIFIIKKKKTSI